MGSIALGFSVIASLYLNCVISWIYISSVIYLELPLEYRRGLGAQESSEWVLVPGCQ